MIRMLLVGYCFGIRSERRLCDEVHLNLGYRWFCRLSLDTAMPDHSTFSKARHGRFRDADLLREVFETVVRRCMAEGLVGGEGSAVDGSLSPPMPAGNAASKIRPISSRMQTAPSPSISPFSMTRRSAPQPRCSRSSSHQSIPPRAGRLQATDLPYSPTPTTTSST